MKSALALVLLITASIGCGGGGAAFVPASKPPAVVCNPPNMLVGGVCTAPPPASTPPPVVPAHYQVIDLIPLPGATGSQANAVSNGRATGYSSFWSGSTGTTRVTVWQSDGTPQDLGLDGKGQAINSQGEVVGYADNTTPQAFLWSRGIVTQLGTLPGFDSSIATGINDSGEVVGIAYVFANPNNEVGFKWTQQTGMFAIAGAATASGINNNGDIAAMTQNLQAAIFAASGTITLLGTLGDFSLAGAVNNQGHACGMSPLVSGGPTHAFFYDGTIHDLGAFGAGDSSDATSMNDQDLIVGDDVGLLSAPKFRVLGIARVVGSGNPFVWSATTGMVPLNSLISADSGWVLSSASGISQDGEIVGAGVVNNEIHGFMLTPE